MSPRSFLLVEDSTVIRDAVAHALARHHAEVAAVASVVEAERALIENAFDVVVADLDLGDPRHDGVHVLTWAERLRPKARRVLISGSANTRIQSALTSGLAHYFFRKPFGVDVVAHLVALTTIEGAP